MNDTDYNVWKRADSQEALWTLGAWICGIWFGLNFFFIPWLTTLPAGHYGSLLVSLSAIVSGSFTLWCMIRRWNAQDTAESALKRFLSHDRPQY